MKLVLRDNKLENIIVKYYFYQGSIHYKLAITDFGAFYFLQNNY